MEEGEGVQRGWRIKKRNRREDMINHACVEYYNEVTHTN
jgi:hypothetical protein